VGDELNLNLNQGAYAIARELREQAVRFGVAVSRLPGGATVIDCGVQAPGGYAAGLAFARACMGGLGEVTLLPWAAGELYLPGVQVCTDRPWAACMAAQYAGWAIKGEHFFAMGSGPARALARVEELFAHLPVTEASAVAVLALEGRKLPTDAVAADVADKCRVAAKHLTLLIAPTASIAGSVQVSARVVETALHKLHGLGFDVTRVRAGWGTAPLAPISADDLLAIGRTNDCILYGGRVNLTVEASDEELKELVGRLPASASGDYGRPFIEIFRRYDHDFYKIDPYLFSPGEIWLTAVESGNTFHAGRLEPVVLRQSLLGE
jgi:methenyltetrahydromethanopterin cyclohydrolase